MAKYASKVVEQAKAWLGLKESDGSHQQIIDVYNSQNPVPAGYKVKYTDAWCATFVSAVAVKLGYTDIIPCECSCERMIKLFQNKGIWVEDDAYVPNPGDIIFYDWDDKGSGDNKGRSDHVGIVEKVVNGKITTIEGNYSNAVKRKTLDVNGRYIRGFGVPKYDVEGQTASKPAQTTVQKPVQSAPVETTTKKTVHTVVKGDSLWNIAKKYLGNGSRYPEIVKLNGLTSTVLQIGQKLTIPNK